MEKNANNRVFLPEKKKINTETNFTTSMYILFFLICMTPIILKELLTSVWQRSSDMQGHVFPLSVCSSGKLVCITLSAIHHKCNKFFLMIL